MELEHRKFLKDNYNNYETAISGYLRNLDLTLMRTYEHIYRTYVDPSFILTIWCGHCRMDMVLRLYNYYNSLPIENIISEKGEKSEVIETEQVIIKKTRKKKNG
jgi:hypothetical protein